MPLPVLVRPPVPLIVATFWRVPLWAFRATLFVALLADVMAGQVEQAAVERHGRGVVSRCR